MDISKIKAELIQLRKEIKHHNKKYYDDDAPEISDYEYDKLMRRLKEIEAEYPEFITATSPTRRHCQTYSGKISFARCTYAFIAGRFQP